jgi:glycosyltransferase involved in cell wall biosynthesis
MWDQLLVGAAPGDAITRSALLLRDALAELGPADLFAQHREPGVEDLVRPLEELRFRRNGDRPLIFHVSIGSWPVFRAIEHHEPSLVVVYHNFSPPEYFADFAPDVADDLIRGRWELERLRDRVRFAIADSEYNAEELHALGYTDVTVVAPTPDIDRLDRVLPDVAMLQRISSWGDGPLVLCVAQQLPHKRIERVLAAMAVLQQEHDPSARLAFVGVDRFHSYSRALRSFARTVGLREPHLLGRVSDAELSALYLRARAFLTLSEHEGFCVPAVEAMALGLPVVASRRAAIPSTVGDAGVLIDDPDDPVLVAGVLHQVLHDPTLRHVLVGRGVSRARALSSASSLPALVDAIVSHGAAYDRHGPMPSSTVPDGPVADGHLTSGGGAGR